MLNNILPKNKPAHRTKTLGRKKGSQWLPNCQLPDHVAKACSDLLELIHGVMRTTGF